MAQLGTVMAELDNLKAAVRLLGEEVEIFERELGKLTGPAVGAGRGNATETKHWSRGRAPASRLEVYLGGEVYSRGVAADTLAEVVMAIGPERIEPLGLRLGGRPLVSRTPPRNSRGHHQVKNWYVYIHSDTAEKKAVLEKIGRALGIPLGVQVVSK